MSKSVSDFLNSLGSNDYSQIDKNFFEASEIVQKEINSLDVSVLIKNFGDLMAQNKDESAMWLWSHFVKQINNPKPEKNKEFIQKSKTILLEHLNDAVGMKNSQNLDKFYHACKYNNLQVVKWYLEDITKFITDSKAKQSQLQRKLLVSEKNSQLISNPLSLALNPNQKHIDTAKYLYEKLQNLGVITSKELKSLIENSNNLITLIYKELLSEIAKPNYTIQNLEEICQKYSFELKEIIENQYWVDSAFASYKDNILSFMLRNDGYNYKYNKFLPKLIEALSNNPNYTEFVKKSLNSNCIFKDGIPLSDGRVPKTAENSIFIEYIVEFYKSADKTVISQILKSAKNAGMDTQYKGESYLFKNYYGETITVPADLLVNFDYKANHKTKLEFLRHCFNYYINEEILIKIADRVFDFKNIDETNELLIVVATSKSAALFPELYHKAKNENQAFILNSDLLKYSLNSLENFKFLVEEVKFDPKENISRLLQELIENKSTDVRIIEYLVKNHGLDLNKPFDYKDMNPALPDTKEMPLIMAVAERRDALVEIMIKNGARVTDVFLDSNVPSTFSKGISAESHLWKDIIAKRGFSHERKLHPDTEGLIIEAGDKERSGTTLEQRLEEFKKRPVQKVVNAGKKAEVQKSINQSARQEFGKRQDIFQRLDESKLNGVTDINKLNNMAQLINVFKDELLNDNSISDDVKDLMVNHIDTYSKKIQHQIQANQTDKNNKNGSKLQELYHKLEDKILSFDNINNFYSSLSGNDKNQIIANINADANVFKQKFEGYCKGLNINALYFLHKILENKSISKDLIKDCKNILKTMLQDRKVLVELVKQDVSYDVANWYLDDAFKWVWVNESDQNKVKRNLLKDSTSNKSEVLQSALKKSENASFSLIIPSIFLNPDIISDKDLKSLIENSAEAMKVFAYENLYSAMQQVGNLEQKISFAKAALREKNTSSLEATMGPVLVALQDASEKIGFKFEKVLEINGVSNFLDFLESKTIDANVIKQVLIHYYGADFVRNHDKPMAIINQPGKQQQQNKNHQPRNNAPQNNTYTNAGLETKYNELKLKDFDSNEFKDGLVEYCKNAPKQTNYDVSILAKLIYEHPEKFQTLIQIYEDSNINLSAEKWGVVLSACKKSKGHFQAIYEKISKLITIDVKYLRKYNIFLSMALDADYDPAIVKYLKEVCPNIDYNNNLIGHSESLLKHAINARMAKPEMIEALLDNGAVLTENDILDGIKFDHLPNNLKDRIQSMIQSVQNVNNTGQSQGQANINQPVVDATTPVNSTAGVTDLYSDLLDVETFKNTHGRNIESNNVAKLAERIQRAQHAQIYARDVLSMIAEHYPHKLIDFIKVLDARTFDLSGIHGDLILKCINNKENFAYVAQRMFPADATSKKFEEKMQSQILGLLFNESNADPAIVGYLKNNHGIDFNTKQDIYRHSDLPLMYAMGRNRGKIVSTLIENGAEVTKTKNDMFGAKSAEENLKYISLPDNVRNIMINKANQERGGVPNPAQQQPQPQPQLNKHEFRGYSGGKVSGKKKDHIAKRDLVRNIYRKSRGARWGVGIALAVALAAGASFMCAAMPIVGGLAAAGFFGTRFISGLNAARKGGRLSKPGEWFKAIGDIFGMGHSIGYDEPTNKEINKVTYKVNSLDKKLKSGKSKKHKRAQVTGENQNKGKSK